MSAESQSTHESFSDYDSRSEEMGAEVERAVGLLAGDGPTGRAETQLNEFVQLASKVPSFSASNLLLVRAQAPDAQLLGTDEFWESHHGRQIGLGADPVWVWEPIWRAQCPKCGNSREYHERRLVDCDQHNRGSPDAWRRGVVGCRPSCRFDITDTRGKPVEVYQWRTAGDNHAESLLEHLKGYAEANDIRVDVVEEPPGESAAPWTVSRSVMDFTPILTIQEGVVPVQEAVHLLRGIAHTQLAEKSSSELRSIETELVSAIVGHRFGLPVLGDYSLEEYRRADSNDVRRSLESVVQTSSKIISPVETRLASVVEYQAIE
jgi:hypothetical protein